MRLSARDYIGHMEGLGLFGPDHSLPDLNSRVWRGYLDLYDAHIGPVDAIEILTTPEGYGFYRDGLAGWNFYTWALLGPLSHPAVPFTAADLVAHADAIAALCDDAPVITETFLPRGHNAATLHIDPPIAPHVDLHVDSHFDPRFDLHFGWVHSPQARLAPTVEDYVISLAAKRRKQRARLYRDYGGPEYRFDFSSRPVNDDECRFITEQTAARWGNEAPYALTQALFPMAAAAVLPDAVRFMRVYNGDDPLFFNSYLVRGDTLTSQSTTRNQAAETTGLGVMIDFKAIEFLCGDPVITTLDPTCRTSIEDPGSIETAKREIVNVDSLRPLLALGAAASLGALLPSGIPYFDRDRGDWHHPVDPSILGRTA